MQNANILLLQCIVIDENKVLFRRTSCHYGFQIELVCKLKRFRNFLLFFFFGWGRWIQSECESLQTIQFYNEKRTWNWVHLFDRIFWLEIAWFSCKVVGKKTFWIPQYSNYFVIYNFLFIVINTICLGNFSFFIITNLYDSHLNRVYDSNSMQIA